MKSRTKKYIIKIRSIMLVFIFIFEKKTIMLGNVFNKVNSKTILNSKVRYF